jgi:hypothetical protein
MTVVEKIHSLQDELLVLGFEKSHNEVARKRREVIQGQLAQIERTCPTSWTIAAQRIG